MFTVDEFAAYIDVPVDEVSEPSVTALQREARVLLRGFAPSLPEDADLWPESAKVVALRVVARGYLQLSSGLPGGVTSVSHSAEGFSQQLGFESGSSQAGLWLSKQDKQLLRGVGGSKAYSVYQGPRERPQAPDVWSPAGWGQW